jgi:SpoVK/Ycf46/Vps4 family AAA+-type ATPase
MFDHITWPKPSSKSEILDLAFLENHENVLMLGAVGTGKTHLASALGIQASARGNNPVLPGSEPGQHYAGEASDRNAGSVST